MFQAGPVDDMMKRARPYLEKDVATAAQVAREGGLDISAFAATEKYFQPK
jgi:hypothetical protein